MQAENEFQRLKAKLALCQWMETSIKTMPGSASWSATIRVARWKTMTSPMGTIGVAGSMELPRLSLKKKG